MNEPINVMIEQALPIVVTVERVEMVEKGNTEKAMPDLIALFELARL